MSKVQEEEEADIGSSSSIYLFSSGGKECRTEPGESKLRLSSFIMFLWFRFQLSIKRDVAIDFL